MSVIVGLLNLAGRPVRRSDVVRLLAPTQYRGRHGRHIVCHENVGFGILLDAPGFAAGRRESPVAIGVPPTIVFGDARIDNRAAVAARLGLPLGPRSFGVDSALLIYAYRRWGSSFAEHLIGDFAVAIWDAARQRLLLTRDHIGRRPLFYHVRQDAFAVFGTEIRNVLAHPDVLPRFDDVMIARFTDLTFYTERSRTFYEGVRRVPAAQTVEWDGRGIERCRRKHWDPIVSGALHDSLSDTECQEAFGELLWRGCSMPLSRFGHRRRSDCQRWTGQHDGGVCG